MKPTNFPIFLKKGGTALLILLICCGISLSSNAGESDKYSIKVPYNYENYDAVISGKASNQGKGTPITVKGSFTNNYWDSFCDINVYLAIINKDGEKGKSKRFYLGDLLEDETGNYELAIAPPEVIGNLELTFIYEICSTRHETPADFITINIPWPPK